MIQSCLYCRFVGEDPGIHCIVPAASLLFVLVMLQSKLHCSYFAVHPNLHCWLQWVGWISCCCAAVHQAIQSYVIYGHIVPFTYTCIR
jgi:hypothetical protein